MLFYNVALRSALIVCNNGYNKVKKGQEMLSALSKVYNEEKNLFGKRYKCVQCERVRGRDLA